MAIVGAVPARVRGAVAAAIDGQRGYLFPFTPVLFGAGIGAYFALKAEPEGAHWLALAAALALLALLGGYRRARGVVCLGAALVLAGFWAGGLRTHFVAAPVLSGYYHGPVQGRIVVIDRSASDKTRLTLDRVVLADFAPGRTPGRVRISLHGPQGYLVPEPGMVVIATAFLSPPRWPTEPGGFDFRRHAWFQGLGAVGYTRTPVLALEPASGGRALAVARLRMRLSAHVQRVLGGQVGAVAAALTTGDRSGLSEGTLEALRAANLAHLLAISGLHMGMLAGFVFAVVRLGLAALPALALRWPTHKIAAGAAGLAGAGYLVLSGGNVATERAFVMAMVMLAAVMLDRQALTLRSVALAAMIVLLRRPEALTGPGFQMSFAATTALVAVFSAVRDRPMPGWARWGIGLVLSSLIAGLATAPIAAAHFGRVPHYGLIANILSVPVMGFLVMPAAVLAAVLAPLGLAWIGLWLMAPGLRWILGVADMVAGWGGAVSHVAAPPGVVLPLLALGGLWCVLWRGQMRWIGLGPVILAAVLWSGVVRPVVLVSETGGLLGVMTEDGRALSKPRGEAFVAEAWLEADGDGVAQADAAERAFAGGLAALGLWHETGRGAAARAVAACDRGGVVVTSARLGAERPDGCVIYDRDRLEETGPLALRFGPEGQLLVETARARSGARPWTSQ